ncbi:MAG TPA: hypothetical protein VFB71_12320 [Ramlibacter sp.]|nr:hypothetical protein [Ramlibacter sp.]
MKTIQDAVKFVTELVAQVPGMTMTAPDPRMREGLLHVDVANADTQLWIDVGEKRRQYYYRAADNVRRPDRIELRARDAAKGSWGWHDKIRAFPMLKCGGGFNGPGITKALLELADMMRSATRRRRENDAHDRKLRDARNATTDSVRAMGLDCEHGRVTVTSDLCGGIRGELEIKPTGRLELKLDLRIEQLDHVLTLLAALPSVKNPAS